MYPNELQGDVTVNEINGVCVYGGEKLLGRMSWNKVKCDWCGAVVARTTTFFCPLALCPIRHLCTISNQSISKQYAELSLPHLRIASDKPVPQDTGNKVSRRATIAGPQNIILGGKTIISSGAIIRGDLRRTGPGHAVVISLGRYCLVGEGCVVRCVALS